MFGSAVAASFSGNEVKLGRKLETSATTAADGLGSNFQSIINAMIDAKINISKDDIFKEMYPVGSIYISWTPLYNVGAVRTTANTNSTIEYSWHGCTFRYISDRRFLYNAGLFSSSTYGPTTYQEHTVLAETGGDATHSHSVNSFNTNNHTLTADQMPSHNHGFSGNAESGSFLAVTYSRSFNGIVTGNAVQNRVDDGTSVGESWFYINFTPSGSISYTGGGQGHGHGVPSHNTNSASSLPPYTTVFMYRRTN